jgi:uncharacterized protein
MDLDMKDRLIIANQLLILEKLYPQEADYYAKHREAIESGYKLHYDWLVEHFSEEMPEEDCTEVLDILDMYRGLAIAYKKFADKVNIEESDVRFPGFDGNYETRQMAYTRYFIVDLGRFEELRCGVKHPDFNSHTQMLDRYRKMLTKWKTYQDKYNMTEDQFKDLLKA